jgi:hypothetical protein
MDPFDPAHPQYNLNMLAATSVARLHRELVGFDKQAAPMREYLETMPYRQLRRPETVQQYVHLVTLVWGRAPLYSGIVLGVLPPP